MATVVGNHELNHFGVGSEMSGSPEKRKKIGQSPNFYVGFWWRCGEGNRLRQTGYTCLIFFLEKGSNTPDQEIGPPNFELCVSGGNALPAV